MSKWCRISLREIPEEGLILDLTLTPDDVGMELPECRLTDDVRFKGIIRKYAVRYILSGRLTANLQFNCSRCLTEFIYPMTSDVLLHYFEDVRRDSSGSDLPENLDEEPDETVRDFINVQSAIIEQLILQIPMKALCSENCKGLCVECGQNWNKGTCNCTSQTIDPRLIKLKNLLEK